MLLDDRFELAQLLPQAFVLAHRVFVFVGGLGQERVHFATFVAAHHDVETLLSKIQGRHFHGCVRSPKIAVPTRIIVEPSAMATSKSWLIPIESSRTKAPGTPSSTSRSLSSRNCRNQGRACS